MKRKLCLCLLLMLLLTACGIGEPKPSNSPAARMVQSIEVSVHPDNDSYDRVYVTQENMNALLSLLRDMPNEDEVTEEPDLNGGQVYYMTTVTFANGEQSVYYLLGHTYLRMGDEPWTMVDLNDSVAYIEYINGHPSDDAAAETTAPPETTLPAETTPETTVPPTT